MLRIRDAQLKPFEDQSWVRFHHQMLGYVHETFPEAFEELTPQEVLEVIQYGIQVAKAYDFHTESGIQCIIHLMFAFGAEFDLDPEFPWAQEILLDGSLTEEEAAERMAKHAQSQCP